MLTDERLKELLRAAERGAHILYASLGEMLRAAEHATRTLKEWRATERATRLLDRWEADDTGYDERAQAALDAVTTPRWLGLMEEMDAYLEYRADAERWVCYAKDGSAGASCLTPQEAVCECYSLWEQQSVHAVPEKPTWEEAAREQAALDAASDDALRIVDDAVESDATGGATWEPAPSDIGGTTCAPETTWGWEEIMRKRADTWKKLAAMDAGEAELDAMVVEREDALLGQAALDAASDEVLRIVDDAVESDATENATWQRRDDLIVLDGQVETLAEKVAALTSQVEDLIKARIKDKHKLRELARRVKYLHNETRTLFDAVGDLTTSKYELGDDLIALTERVAVLESWRSASVNEQNNGSAEEEWMRRMDEMSAYLEPPSRTLDGGWQCVCAHDDRVIRSEGDTPQAAVAAAWKAWKEARDE